MKYANHEQAGKYLKQGSDFADNTKAPFGDVKRVVYLAVAEYLANKDGITLYESVADEITPI